jgi:hypothetical protein
VRFTMPEIASLRKLGDIRKLLQAKNVRLNEPATGTPGIQRVA